MPATTGIIAIFCLAAALLLLVVLDSRVRLWIKVAAIVCVTVAVGASYPLLLTQLGWPVEAPLPPRFQLMSTYIQEPNKSAGLPGAIYLWAAEIDDTNQQTSPPRSYRTPLTEATADMTAEAQDTLDAGTEVIGEIAETPPSAAAQSEQAEADAAERTEPMDGDNTTIFSGLLGPVGEPAYINYLEMPSVELPPKE